MASPFQTQKLQITVDRDFKTWFALIVLFVCFFVLPIFAVSWLNSFNYQQPAANTAVSTGAGNVANGGNTAASGAATNAGNVLGVSTDNTSHYFNIPILNFNFDTQFKEPATVSFVVGLLLFIVAVVVIVLMFRDFREREHKYD